MTLGSRLLMLISNYFRNQISISCQLVAYVIPTTYSPPSKNLKNIKSLIFNIP